MGFYALEENRTYGIKNRVCAKGAKNVHFPSVVSFGLGAYLLGQIDMSTSNFIWADIRPNKTADQTKNM